MRKQTNDKELEQIVKESISWSQVIKKCGSKIGGGSYQYFQSRIRKLKFDTSHFLGQAAHTGFRNTSIGRKFHWSEVLVDKKTNDREKCKRLRRSYTEYCNEKNIPIECVDCKNTGNWMDKKMKLEINHKNSCRGNNIPDNLEWICPNCHSIKTF